MAATAAALSTYIQVREKPRELIVLTNFERSDSATSINSTVMEAFCTTAINSFEAQYTTYDPDTYSLHYDTAWYLTMAALYDMANKIEKGDEYRKKIESLTPGLKRVHRTMTPTSNSTTVPTERTSDTSPFDDSVFTDIIPT